VTGAAPDPAAHTEGLAEQRDIIVHLQGVKRGSSAYTKRVIDLGVSEIRKLRAEREVLTARCAVLDTENVELRDCLHSTYEQRDALEARTTPPDGIDIADVRRWMNSVRASRSFIEASEGGADVVGSQMWGFRLIANAYGPTTEPEPVPLSDAEWEPYADALGMTPEGEPE